MDYKSKPNIRANSKRYEQKQRDKAIDILGGRCASPTCGWINEDGSRGCIDRRCLQIDHKNGGGRQHAKVVCKGTMYRDIINNPNRDEWFQLLCANCNWIKKVVNDEVHHPPKKVNNPPSCPNRIKNRHSTLGPAGRGKRWCWIAGEYVIVPKNYDDTPEHLFKDDLE